MTTGRRAAGRDYEPFIDRREVGRRLQVSSRQVSIWLERGLLPHYRLDNAIRFKWSEIEHHLRGLCRVPGVAELTECDPKGPA